LGILKAGASQGFFSEVQSPDSERSSVDTGKGYGYTDDSLRCIGAGYKMHGKGEETGSYRVIQNFSYECITEYPLEAVAHRSCYFNSYVPLDKRQDQYPGPC